MIIIKFLYISFDVISYIAYTIDNITIDVHNKKVFWIFLYTSSYTDYTIDTTTIDTHLASIYSNISFYLIYRSYNIYMIKLSMRITQVSLYTLLYNQRLAQKAFIKDIFKNKPKG